MSNPLRTAGLAFALAGLISASTAESRPLTLLEVFQFGQYLDCMDTCGEAPAPDADYVSHRTYQECVVECGFAPRLWEKNGITPTDRTDHELALLEYQDAQDPTQALICYGDVDETVVIPGALCSGKVCEAMPECTADDCELSLETDLQCEDKDGEGICWWGDKKRPAACPQVVCDAAPERTIEQCADVDNDGLPKWLEDHLDYLDPDNSDPLCSGDAVCGFTKTCEYAAEIAAGLCVDRECAATDSCTAFHMELVAQDDQQILIHVYYDYTPIPARVLDLFIEYNHEALTLEDARPLAPLLLQGKEMAVSHLSDGTMRLSVFDTGGTHPIPTGPIIELVFQRHVLGGTEVRFSQDDLLQKASVAPLQGDDETQAQLADDEGFNLWGSPVGIVPLSEVTTRLKLWYGFDTVDNPISYAKVPSGADLCEVVPDCANEEDEPTKVLMIARLDELQSGTLAGGESIAGLSGSAIYMDGAADHMRLPVHYREPLAPIGQSFSMATWFYTEGNSVSELKKTPQILFGHLAFNERTRFGLALKPEGGETVSLVLFDGDLLSKVPKPIEVVVATGIKVRTWHHVGFSLDTATGSIDVYLDGERVELEVKPGQEFEFKQPPAAVACPQFFAGTDVKLHEEGDVLGGRPPEIVYLAVNQSNLYKIHRMDSTGLGDSTVIGDGQFSYRDPDYSALLDKIVYSANVSGDFEIWIADGDGENRKQLTVGFGDSFRGVSARRPRWAPDGSAIVFESDIFDVLANDNAFARVKHLYYIAYDAPENAVNIETAGGDVLTQLDYEALLASQTVTDYRLTGAVLDRHHGNAQWLLGKNLAAGHKGVLLIDTSNPGWDGHKVHRLTIGEYAALSTSEEILGLGDPDHELRLIAGHHSEKAAVPNPIVTARMVYARSQSCLTGDDQFVVEAPVAAPAGEEGFDVKVLHQPANYDENCWDSNFNTLKDTDEDRNQDNLWNKDDCYPYQVRNLYVEFDPLVWKPVLEDKDGNPQAPGALLGPISQGGLGKFLKLAEAYPAGRAFVRVEVLSPLNALPITAGEIAVLRFVKLNLDPQVIDFAPFGRVGQDDVMVKDLTTVGPPVVFENAGLFERLDQAVFSPDGERLMLVAVSKARPILLATESVISAADAAKVLLSPTAIRGIDWVRQDRFMACNWVGGYLHPQKKTILQGLRGGLDDFRIYSGLRHPQAFRSEAERGIEFLANAGLDGQLDSKLPSCGNNHLECPPYYLCIESECKMIACDPNDPFTCTKHSSRCTLRPETVEQENLGKGGADIFQWVCAADCNVDQQCFTQQCFNGPCRFCEKETLSCIECRETIKQYGDLKIATIEGCPDQRSFRCEAGECVTECYAFADDQTIYLCDPALEYCEQGSCVLHDWDWWDVAPGSFSGGEEMKQLVPPDNTVGWNGYTQAVDQRIPIKITAYGVSDYNSAPEIVVEVKGGPFYGSGWHRVGEAIVHAKTSIQAQNRPITLTVPHGFNDLRLRLVKSPYENVMGGATGLRSGDKDFCLTDLEKTAAAAGEPYDPTPCYRTAQGSQYNLGYRSTIPFHEAAIACKEHGQAGCPSIAQGEHDYVHGGAPAAIVLEVLVDGASAFNNINQNKVCAYGSYTKDPLIPIDNAAPKKVFYGDIETELSNEAAQWCVQNPDECKTPGEFGLIDFDYAGKGFALLNCNVYDPANQGEQAQILFQNIIIVKEWPASAGAIVLDNGDVCTVEINKFLNQPCFSLVGPSLDPANGVISQGPSLAYGSLDFSLFRSFGHDMGFEGVPLPEFDLTMALTGPPPKGDVVLTCNGEDVTVVGGLTKCPSKVKWGKNYEVTVKTQPADTTLTCFVGGGKGSMPKADKTISVVCAQVHGVSGTVSGLSSTVLLLSETSLTGDLIDSKEFLKIGANGDFAIKAMLPNGGTYDVKVVAHPQGQKCTITNGTGTMGDADVVDIAVTCEDVVERKLTFDVSGLEGTGLKVLEKKSGVTLEPGADGSHVFNFPFVAGDEYDIVLTKLPKNPVQYCAISAGGSGVMPDADHNGAKIECNTLPTYKVGAEVIGLLGAGLELQLNGDEKLSVDAPDDPSKSPTVWFTTPLVTGNTYTVTVATPPASQKCTVEAGVGVIEAADTKYIKVLCVPDVDTKQYVIGGTITGLKGEGLTLKLSGGAQFLNVDVNGSWEFKTKVGPGTAIDVQVDQQPISPTQKCTVGTSASSCNAKGVCKVGDKDVHDITITCVDAALVTLEISRPDSDGAAVGALLFSNGPNRKLVAQAPDDVVLENGKALFIMAAAGADPKPGEVSEASLPPGDYSLYVYINHDGDSDPQTTKPLFNAGDYGIALPYKATTSAGVVSIGTAQLKPLGLAKVIGQMVSFPLGGVSKQKMLCWWALPGVGLLTEKPGPFSPVVATSSVNCADAPADDDGKNAGKCISLAITKKNGAVPQGSTYEVTCWIDEDESGTINGGDYYGFGAAGAGPTIMPLGIK